MRPAYKVDLPHDAFEDTDELREWLTENIGEPYPFDDRASYKCFDWSKDGKWCCYMESNRYNRFNKEDKVVDTWWFSDEKDAVFFSLRWL